MGSSFSLLTGLAGRLVLLMKYVNWVHKSVKYGMHVATILEICCDIKIHLLNELMERYFLAELLNS